METLHGKLIDMKDVLDKKAQSHMKQAEKNDGINWKAFRAQVAKMMLPLMYKQVEINGRMVSSHAQQAVEAAVEIAEMLERRLRQ